MGVVPWFQVPSSVPQQITRFTVVREHTVWPDPPWVGGPQDSERVQGEYYICGQVDALTAQSGHAFHWDRSLALPKKQEQTRKKKRT